MCFTPEYSAEDFQLSKSLFSCKLSDLLISILYKFIILLSSLILLFLFLSRQFEYHHSLSPPFPLSPLSLAPRPHWDPPASDIVVVVLSDISISASAASALSESDGGKAFEIAF